MTWEEKVRAQKGEQAHHQILKEENERKEHDAILSLWNKLILFNNEIAPDIRLQHSKKEIFIPKDFDSYKSDGFHETLGPLVFMKSGSSCWIHLGDRITPNAIHIGFRFQIGSIDYRDDSYLARVPSESELANNKFIRFDTDDKIIMLLKNLCSNNSRYWNQGIKAGRLEKGCFIATAVYGSYSAPEVLVLREFRDQILERNFFGRYFIKSYYLLSPALTFFISRNDMTKKIVKSGIDMMVRCNFIRKRNDNKG